MATGYTYAGYQQAVGIQIPTTLTDPNFVAMLPNAINYAEMSIYRDLDFLATHGDVSLGPQSSGTSSITLSSDIIVLEQLFYAKTFPAGPTIPIPPLSQAALRAIYGTAPVGPPQYFSVVGNAAGTNWTPAETVLLGPATDDGYTFTAYATQREAPLSATNTSTFISTQLGDLFWAAGMIYWSGYLKNFGALSDNPQMAVSWEQEYQRLLKGAAVEEARKKFQSQGWAPELPAPLATTPR